MGIDKLNDFWDDIIWQIWGAKDRLKWKVRADMSQKCGHVKKKEDIYNQI